MHHPSLSATTTMEIPNMTYSNSYWDCFADAGHSATLAALTDWRSALSAASEPKRKTPGAESSRVIQLDATDPRWDAFVLATPGATVFHHSGWLAALEHENGQPALKLACVETDGTMSGILPLMATRGLPLGLGGASTGRRLSSLPRTPLAGPVATSDLALATLVRSAVARANSSGRSLQLKQAAGTLDDMVPGLRGEPWRLSYVKPLPGDASQLRFGNARNNARIGWAVRRAKREGLRVRDATSEADLREWYRLYLDTNRWRGLPPRPYRFFRAALEHLGPGGFLRLLVVDRGRSGRDTLIAGSVLLMLGDTTFYAFNGRKREALPMRPNDLLQWQAMHDATSAGCRWYDFGEVPEGNEGLASFKAKWGTHTRPLVRYHAPPLERGESEYPLPEDSTWQHRVALGAWRHVPLAVTAFAGDRVYRFL
jgi:CelD/BcsL family acetyltransferase involved in cellulose biosynthesis